MDYYHNLVTEKSWDELQNLRRRLSFVLIGGWAVYLYTNALKSKDIDILVDYDKLPIIDKMYNLRKNNRLKKYEAVKEEVQIDIYLPHYSEIGIPVRDLQENAVSLMGFYVPKIAYLIALKIFTFQQRNNSVKGRKDFLDIIALLSLPSIDYKSIKQIATDFRLETTLNNFLRELKNTYELAELQINKHSFSRLKKSFLANLS